jgi:formyl-CoA transferase
LKLGETANEAARGYGKPLDGVRVLAAEQMQALPFATQLLARLGADVVKVEHPVHGESGRASTPFITDPDGRHVGCTYLRNNLSKRSVGIDFKQKAGRELFLRLVPHFDVIAENFKGGALDAMGLGYDAVRAVHPGAVYVSVSGFGNTTESPYADWPAYAPVAEAMAGLYEYRRQPGQPPVAAPVGALGDIGAAMFAVVGILAALRHRDRTGEGQYVDIAMFDCMLAFGDIVSNFYSMGAWPETGSAPALILHGFAASDGYFVMQVGREHQFARLAELVGHPEWVDDARFAERRGWVEHLDGVLRPAIEGWAATHTKLQACKELAAAGIAAGPSNHPRDVVRDPHVEARNMLVEVPRPDGVTQPVLVPGNPVKLSKMTDGPDVRVPWVGEHTEAVLRAELGVSDVELAQLRADGAIA